MEWGGEHSMNQVNLVIDVAKCEDCNDCFLSCKDEYVGNDWLPYSVSQPLHGHRWMDIMRKERGQYPLIDVAYRPTPCMHCDDPACIKEARDKAVYKRDDGIVIIDPAKAKGQKAIVDSCPYGVIWWNEELDVPQKCTFCAHLLDDGWKEPRCVQSCPTGAFKFFHLEESEMRRIIESEKLEVLHPEYDLQPRVYYKNLYRFARCFIAGSIAVDVNGVTDCVEGTRITLSRGSTKIDKTVSDTFGDFKFDDLTANSGLYRLEISHQDHDTKTVEIELKTSQNVGMVWI
jgi:Fe-S-cluster-containing dehydrogenase component